MDRHPSSLTRSAAMLVSSLTCSHKLKTKQEVVHGRQTTAQGGTAGGSRAGRRRRRIHGDKHLERGGIVLQDNLMSCRDTCCHPEAALPLAPQQLWLSAGASAAQPGPASNSHQVRKSQYRCH